MHRTALPLALAAALAGAYAVPAAAQTAIAAGQSVTGRLTATDPVMPDGSHYDTYVIRGRPGERVVVVMESGDVDAYLYWGLPRGDEWRTTDSDDDGAGGTDSRLVVTLGRAGYQLRAGSLSEGETGTYRLSVRGVADVAAQSIRVGESVRGRLQSGDYVGDEGFEDHFVIRGTPGQTATITAASTDIDTYLLFGEWAGGVLRATHSNDDDEYGMGTDSRLVVDFRDAREYRVVVRSFVGDEEGAYALTVHRGAVGIPAEAVGEDEGEYTDAPRPVGPIRAGQTITGTLDEDDDVAEDDSFVDLYTYNGRAGEVVVVTLQSDNYEAYLSIGTLEDGGFRELQNDDDSGGGTDARLRFTLPRTGTYGIYANSLRAGETGTYTLRVESRR